MERGTCAAFFVVPDLQEYYFIQASFLYTLLCVYMFICFCVFMCFQCILYLWIGVCSVIRSRMFLMRQLEDISLQCLLFLDRRDTYVIDTGGRFVIYL